MKPEDLKPEMLEVCVARDCFDHNPYFSPQQVADAIESAMDAAETSDIRSSEWRNKIAELRKPCQLR